MRNPEDGTAITEEKLDRHDGSRRTHLVFPFARPGLARGLALALAVLYAGVAAVNLLTAGIAVQKADRYQAQVHYQAHFRRIAAVMYGSVAFNASLSTLCLAAWLLLGRRARRSVLAGGLVMSIVLLVVVWNGLAAQRKGGTRYDWIELMAISSVFLYVIFCSTVEGRVQLPKGSENPTGGGDQRSTRETTEAAECCAPEATVTPTEGDGDGDG
jgi:drug/metabolite transporter (DMT)-like permease